LASSYFDHDAFTHHALHILDAPDYTTSKFSWHLSVEAAVFTKSRQ